MRENPKTSGSGIVTCRPNVGRCPLGCAECYYNAEGYWQDRDVAYVPTLEQVAGRVVRVNDGLDSNVDRGVVLAGTRQYEHRFYGTSIPQFDFEGRPVVFTCNGRESIFTTVTDEVMAVRVRCTTWGTRAGEDDLVRHYVEQGVPVILTFMRFGAAGSIPEQYRHGYERGRSVLNEYWKATVLAKLDMLTHHMSVAGGKNAGLVRVCGTLWSGLCRDCGTCEALYWRWVKGAGG